MKRTSGNPYKKYKSLSCNVDEDECLKENGDKTEFITFTSLGSQRNAKFETFALITLFNQDYIRNKSRSQNLSFYQVIKLV